ncbi:MAG: hypothetical protein ACRC6V_04365 [Bacteroidales bacterium]
MANWFEEIGDGIVGLLKHPIDEIKWMADETKGVVKPLLKGDISESWDSFKGSFGRHNDMMSENIAKPLFGDNKLTQNPDAVAGAVVGSFLAAPAIMGSFGSGGSGMGGFGTEGAFGNYFKPSSLSKPGLGSEGVGWKPGANNLQGSNFLPTDYAGAKEAGMGAEGIDWGALSKTLQSIKLGDESPKFNSGGVGGKSGGGRYDKSVFENPLLTREMNALYSKPLYNDVTKGGR